MSLPVATADNLLDAIKELKAVVKDAEGGELKTRLKKVAELLDSVLADLRESGEIEEELEEEEEDDPDDDEDEEEEEEEEDEDEETEENKEKKQGEVEG